jgi:D-glycero-D-manno-heptose 1,7-bisphosphate phosphatase
VNKSNAVFLDRDGVLNKDNTNYTYRVADFQILSGVIEALQVLHQAGYKLIVVTNQSGIAQGIYTHADVAACHAYMQQQCDHVIDHFYYSPYHPSATHSLSRKPGTLMFEKAQAKFNIDFGQSWMVGDRGRDIMPARQLGIRTIQIGHEIEEENKADFTCENLKEASSLIINTIKNH